MCSSDHADAQPQTHPPKKHTFDMFNTKGNRPTPPRTPPRRRHATGPVVWAPVGTVIEGTVKDITPKVLKVELDNSPKDSRWSACRIDKVSDDFIPADRLRKVFLYKRVRALVTKSFYDDHEKPTVYLSLKQSDLDGVNQRPSPSRESDGALVQRPEAAVVCEPCQDYLRGLCTFIIAPGTCCPHGSHMPLPAGYQQWLVNQKLDKNSPNRHLGWVYGGKLAPVADYKQFALAYHRVGVTAIKRLREQYVRVMGPEKGGPPISLPELFYAPQGSGRTHLWAPCSGGDASTDVTGAVIAVRRFIEALLFENNQIKPWVERFDKDTDKTYYYKYVHSENLDVCGHQKYYPGKISRDGGDGTFDIDYDDGESETRVEQRLIRAKDGVGGGGAFAEGDKIEVIGARYRVDTHPAATKYLLGHDVDRQWNTLKRNAWSLVRGSKIGPDVPLQWSAHNQRNHHDYTEVTERTLVEIVAKLGVILDVLFTGRNGGCETPLAVAPALQAAFEAPPLGFDAKMNEDGKPNKLQKHDYPKAVFENTFEALQKVAKAAARVERVFLRRHSARLFAKWTTRPKGSTPEKNLRARVEPPPLDDDEEEAEYPRRRRRAK